MLYAHATRVKFRMVYARFSVHVELDAKLPKTITLMSKFGNWEQKIESKTKPNSSSL